MIHPSSVCLFIPSGLRKFKLDLFERIGRKIVTAGGHIARDMPQALTDLPDDIIPIVGCSPELTPLYAEWKTRGRTYCYWDRGYARRVFATWLPRGSDGGYYRFHVNSFQLQQIRDVPGDRWAALRTDVLPWQRGGRHIVIAAPTATYSRFHGIQDWLPDTLHHLSLVTDRQLIIRDKESRRPLQADLDGAHCLVAHGSIAAVESVILGCPVVVDRSSAAALVGLTDLGQIEKPIYPERDAWVRSLSYSQWNENELVDGSLFRMLQ